MLSTLDIVIDDETVKMGTVSDTPAFSLMETKYIVGQFTSLTTYWLIDLWLIDGFQLDGRVVISLTKLSLMGTMVRSLISTLLKGYLNNYAWHRRLLVPSM